MSHKMRRLVSIALMLSMVFAVLGTTAVFAKEPISVMPMLIGADVDPDYHLLQERDTYYESGTESYHCETKAEYTFFANGMIKTEKITETRSDSSDKTITEKTYSQDGSFVKGTITQTVEGKTTVMDIGSGDVPGSGDAVFTYDSNGYLVSVKGDGWEYKMTNDADGLCTSTTYYENGKEVSIWKYTYDAQGNCTSETEYRDGKQESVTTMTYNSQGRLATETYTGATYSWKYTYSYDSSNRISGYDYTSGSEKYHISYQYTQSGDKLTVTIEIRNVTGGKNELARKVVSEYQYIDAIPFTDVPKSEYYYNAVKWASSNGITAGTTATTFSPNEKCTRAQMVAFLWRAAGRPAPKSTSCPFTDVKTSDYYYEAVLWAYENEITAGTSETEFSPDGTCNRAMAVSFLWRLENRPNATGSNPFSDVKSSEYYYKAVLWAAENNITYGTSATTFSPDENCTRAQIVTFLYRLLG